MKKSGVIKIDNCVKEEHKEKNTSKETVWQQEKNVQSVCERYECQDRYRRMGAVDEE